jgi:hypothetical protein
MYLATGVIAAGVIVALTTAAWALGVLVAAVGIGLWLVAGHFLRRHVHEQGHPVLDYGRLGRTFRWW